MVPSGRSAGVATSLTGRELQGERPLDVDQSNESVVVGEQVVVKWLRPAVPVPHPGVELLENLRQAHVVGEDRGVLVLDPTLQHDFSLHHSLATELERWRSMLDGLALQGVAHRGAISPADADRWVRRAAELELGLDTGRLTGPDA